MYVATIGIATYSTTKTNALRDCDSTRVMWESRIEMVGITSKFRDKV